MTPHLFNRAVAAGFVPGSGNVEVWLVGRAEKLAEMERAAAMDAAVLTVPEVYVGVVSDAVAEEIERLRARNTVLESFWETHR